MSRTADAPPLALDHFLVDPDLREIHRDAVAGRADDHALDGHLGAFGKANRTAHLASHFGETIAERRVTNAALGAIHDLECAAPTPKQRPLRRPGGVVDTLGAPALRLCHAHEATNDVMGTLVLRRRKKKGDGMSPLAGPCF